jgi:hypothetical protein
LKSDPEIVPAHHLNVVLQIRVELLERLDQVPDGVSGDPGAEEEVWGPVRDEGLGFVFR